MVVEGEMSNQTLVKARLWVKATWVMFNLETLISTVSSKVAEDSVGITSKV